MYRVLPIRTKYWRPGADYGKIIVNSIKDHIRDGDIVVIAEKAISVARGNLVDEAGVKPGLFAHVLAAFWMRRVWGHFLGRLCYLKEERVRRLRDYPLREGAAHKQVIFERVGLISALRHASEGGIDISNVPGSWACLPLESPRKEAKMIRKEILRELRKDVSVMIVDSDKTYSLGGLHLTPRPSSVPGVRFLGFFAYLIGRMLRFRRRSTPVGVSGSALSLDEILRVAEGADRARGHGAGPTLWDMANLFGTGTADITWDMLDEVSHYPIVLVRREDATQAGRLRGKV